VRRACSRPADRAGRLSFLLVLAVGACCGGPRPAKPAGLDAACNPGQSTCPPGLSCVELFAGLSQVDGGLGPPNDKTCRLHCNCDDECPDGYRCLVDVPRAASNVCVVNDLKLPM